jgi:ActR/RegA family two-component response regulator
VGPGGNILIVEDEEEWRQFYKRAVDDHAPDLTVMMAESRAAAERLIDAAKFAVAFVDVSLDPSDGKNTDGLKVMQKIRKTGDETSIIVITGAGGQNALSIARDAIKEFGAYDTVPKASIDPVELEKLFAGGLQAYQKAAATGRTAVRDALRGGTAEMSWDDQVTRAIGFRGDVQRFYGFLNDLMADRLPIVSRDGGQPVTIDPDLGLVHGDYWSRGTATAAAVCFGAPAQFDKAIDTARADGMLLGHYQVGKPASVLDDHGIKGAVFPLQGARREDFAGQRVGS